MVSINPILGFFGYKEILECLITFNKIIKNISKEISNIISWYNKLEIIYIIRSLINIV
jgi:hypothetical protein